MKTYLVTLQDDDSDDTNISVSYIRQNPQLITCEECTHKDECYRELIKNDAEHVIFGLDGFCANAE